MSQTIDSQGPTGPSINSTSYVTLYTFSVPANTLKGPVGRRLRLSIIGEILNNSGAGRVYTVLASFGGTTIAEDALASMTNSATRRFFSIDAEITWNTSATQASRVTIAVGPAAAPTVGQTGDWAGTNFLDPSSITFGTSVNTANANTLLVQIKSDDATATQTFIVRGATLELV